tara:strand:+ start:265 stop:408 length:144 start_codon:yes stop_codon:yes gene_type:complete
MSIMKIEGDSEITAEQALAIAMKKLTEQGIYIEKLEKENEKLVADKG